MRAYYLFTAFMTFWCLMRVPTKLSPVDNCMASLLIALAAGWVFWPVALWAALRSRE